MSGNVRFILVEPQEAGNVGAAARGMKNFGFSQLSLVGSLPELTPLADWWASGASDLVKSASRLNTLDEAVAGSHVVVATTSLRGRDAQANLSPSEVAALRASLGPDQEIAIVFGRERSGLTSAEIARCHSSAVIPTSSAFPTMNLAQSVTIFCYELSKAQRVTEVPVRELPAAELVERLHHRAQTLLLEAGYLHPENPDRVYKDLRRLLSRAAPDQRELTILLGIVRQLEWRLQREKSGESE